MANVDIFLRMFGQNQVEGGFRAAAASGGNMAKSIKLDVASINKEIGGISQRTKTLELSLQNVGGSSNKTKQQITGMAQSSSTALRETESRAKAVGIALMGAAKSGAEAWTGMEFSVGGVINKVKELEGRMDAFRKKVGTGMIVGGVAGGATLGKGVVDAGQLAATQKALEVELGSPDAAANMMGRIKEFDKQSPFDFQESARGFQRSLAVGFKPDEVPELMRIIGDATAGTAGNTESFEGITRAIGQMQSKGKISMEEINQLAERNINALQILQDELKLTDEQKAELMSGKLTLQSDTAVPALLKGLDKKYSGGMEAQLETLPGSFSALQGAAKLAGAEVGEHLVPSLVLFLNVSRKLVETFNNLPEPVHKIIAFSMAFNSGMLILGGTLLMLATPLMSIYGTFKLLTTVLPFLGRNLLQLGATAIPRLLPLLGQLGGALSGMGAGGLVGGIGKAIGALTGAGGLASVLSVALPLAIATGVGLMIKSVEDKLAEKYDKMAEGIDPMKPDTKAANTKEGALEQAEYYREQAEKLEKVANRRNPWGLPGSENARLQIESNDAATEAMALRITEARLRKSAKKLPSAPKAEESSEVKGVFLTAPGAIGGLNVPGGAEDDNGAAQIEDQIEALDDQKRQAKGKANAALRDALTEQIDLLREQLKDVKAGNAAAKRATAAQKKMQRDLERAAKKRTRDAERAAKEDIDAEQMLMSVEETRVKVGFDTRIAELEARRDEAADEKDEARERQLSYEIDVLNAQRDLALAKLQADREAMEDDTRAEVTAEKARIEYEGAMRKAQIELNKAMKSKVKIGLDMLRGLKTSQPVSAIKEFFNPNAGRAFDKSAINPMSGESVGLGDFHRQVLSGGTQIGNWAGMMNAGSNLQFAGVGDYQALQGYSAPQQASQSSTGPRYVDLDLAMNTTEDSNGDTILRIKEQEVRIVNHARRDRATIPGR